MITYIDETWKEENTYENIWLNKRGKCLESKEKYKVCEDYGKSRYCMVDKIS